MTLGISALVILVAGLFPKFSALLTTIPYMYGRSCTVSVFASIIDRYEAGYDGGNELPQHLHRWLGQRLGMGVSQASASLSSFPAWVTTHLRQSPVVIPTPVPFC